MSTDADVSDLEQIGRLVDETSERLKGLDILVSNAGIEHFGAHRSFLHHTLYASSKAAVESMVLNLAPELGQRGITINAIAPGGTATDMANSATQDYFRGRDNVNLAAEIKAMMPLGRLASPEEIAAAVAFLVSPDASCMTGRALAVDGGMR